MAVAESTIREVSQTCSVFRNIMAAADYSEASRRAVAEAAGLAARSGGRLTVIHVAHPDWRYEILDGPQIELERSDAQRRLRSFIDDIDCGWEIEGRVMRCASVAQAVVSALTDAEADLLVIGTRGRGGLTKIALGSVAEELLRTAPCPVMTIGPKAEIAAAFQVILFATDFGKGASKAAPLAVGMARAHRAKLILLHMLPPVPMPSSSLSAFAPSATGADEVAEWERSSRKRGLRELRECLPTDCGLEREPELIVGMDFLPEGLLMAADKYKADLIVMGAHQAGTGRVAAHNPWTAVHEVVRDAPCPVLTVAG